MSAAMQNSRNRNRSRQHPVSGRGGYPSYKRETSDPEASNSSPVRGLYRDHRTAMMLCSFMGTRTSVKTRNGSTYKGHAIGFSHTGDIALTDAKLEDDDNNLNPSLPGLIIPKETFVVCKTNGVDLKGICCSSTDFTDSGIVGRMNGNSDSSLRELQPWQDDDIPDVNPTLSLDDVNGGWDSHSMFQANRDKFNVKSTYNEDLPEYTTKLPDPGSEGYEERQKFAQKHAEEIEQSEGYQNRIAKELGDSDEESQFSAVHSSAETNMPHRLQESNSNSGKNVYTIPALRAESDQAMRNGALKGQGRGARHNSPYSPSPSHIQQQPQHHHQNLQQNARPMNNHYQGPPPMGASLNRNQGPVPLHSRQQNHAPLHHSHHQQHPAQQYQQQPPPPHPGMNHQPPISQQNQRPSQQQLISPSSQHPIKPHPPHSHPQNVPSSLSSPSMPQPPPHQAQHLPPQRVSPPHPLAPVQQPQAVKGASTNGPLGSSQANHLYRQISTEGKNGVDVIGHKGPQMDINQQVYHQKPTIGHQSIPSSLGGQNVSASSSSSGSLADVQQMGQPGSVTSPSPALVPDRRVVDTSPEERSKIGQSLHDFKKNFVLESNGAHSVESPRPLDNTDSSSVSSTPASSSVATTPVSTAPEIMAQLTEQALEASLRSAEKLDDEMAQAPKSKLNPNAKEFKPKSQPTQMDAQSPSPQPRSSPHMPQMVSYPPQQTVLMPYQYIMTNQLNPQRKRATVSLGAGVVSDLTHQVTGQPLLATQQPGMMYIQTPSQSLPAGYQFYSPQLINPRMVGPGSLTIAQAGQMAGLDQAAAQNQPQPVFMTTQQQVQTPIPAHLHHQATHAQSMPHLSSNQQVQQTHVPNPAPSPVQQHNPQSMPQQLSHHMPQGSSQSATPQPAHYPQQMTFSYTHGMPAVPRTSMSGQQNMSVGHSPMGFMSGSQFAYNGNPAQYAFAPAPQTAQSSSHGSGPQTHQYVVMPQPNPQGHPSMQQHTGQPYATTAIPYQSQHIMQGPPQMPPGHNSNPNQGSPHLIHPGMPAGLHQQVSGTQSGMYMQIPSTLQYHQQ